MKRLMIGITVAIAMAGCCTHPSNGIRESGTTYVAVALAPIIEKECGAAVQKIAQSKQ